MEIRDLVYKNAAVRYLRIGSGSAIMLAFHGYGEDAAAFSFLEPHIGQQYTLYAFDLPFHGETSWQEGIDFTVDDVQQIIAILLQQHQHQHPSGSRLAISLLGFSVGGRVALSFYQSNPGIIKKMMLLAPDGMKLNFWYWLATQSRLGNRLFAFSMKKPGWFFAVLKFINRLGFVNASVYKFVNSYIGNPEARTLLYKRWTGLRRLKPDLPLIRAYIMQYKTPVRILYGKYDRIILPGPGKRFQKGISTYCNITDINCGHQVLHPKHTDEILKAIRY